VTVRDLSRDQIDELKQAYVTEMVGNPSYMELADASNVPDGVIYRHYDGVHFGPDDFWCSAGGNQ